MPATRRQVGPEPVERFESVAARDASMVAPNAGQAALTLDDGALRVYYGAFIGWRLPWGSPWGFVAKTSVTTPANLAGSGLIFAALDAAATLTDVPVGRRLRIRVDYANYELQDEVLGVAVFDANARGVFAQSHFSPGDPLNDGQLTGWWQYNVRAGVHTSMTRTDYAASTNGTMRLVPAWITYDNGLPAAFSGPIELSVEDVGPASGPLIT